MSDELAQGDKSRDELQVPDKVIGSPNLADESDKNQIVDKPPPKIISSGGRSHRIISDEDPCSGPRHGMKF